MDRKISVLYALRVKRSQGRGLISTVRKTLHEKGCTTKELKKKKPSTQSRIERKEAF